LNSSSSTEANAKKRRRENKLQEKKKAQYPLSQEKGFGFNGKKFSKIWGV